jgi:hypothetical protein
LVTNVTFCYPRTLLTGYSFSIFTLGWFLLLFVFRVLLHFEHFEVITNVSFCFPRTHLTGWRFFHFLFHLSSTLKTTYLFALFSLSADFDYILFVYFTDFHNLILWSDNQCNFLLSQNTFNWVELFDLWLILLVIHDIVNFYFQYYGFQTYLNVRNGESLNIGS